MQAQALSSKQMDGAKWETYVPTKYNKHKFEPKHGLHF